MKLTIQQTAAFVDVLTGGEPVGVDQDGNETTRPRSPVALAHLEAVLGLGRAPDGRLVNFVARCGPAAIGRTDGVECVNALTEYLEAVVAELRAITAPKPETK